jgi:tRNA modification GTPase
MTAIKEADLVLLVVDATTKLDATDLELLSLVKDKPQLILANKKDVIKKYDLKEALYISSLNKDGFDELEALILNKLNLHHLNVKDFNYLSNARHIAKLKDAKKALKEALLASNQQLSSDMILIDLNQAYTDLGEILGTNSYNDLLDELFSQFCLGK